MPLSLRFLTCASIIVLFPATALASTIYAYTGQSYVNFLDGTVPGQYTAAMSVTGSMTLPVVLSANLSDADVTASVLAFSFSDGRSTLSGTDVLSIVEFVVSTDGSGNIVSWGVSLQDNPVKPDPAHSEL